MFIEAFLMFLTSLKYLLSNMIQETSENKIEMWKYENNLTLGWGNHTPSCLPCVHHCETWGQEGVWWFLVDKAAKTFWRSRDKLWNEAPCEGSKQWMGRYREGIFYEALCTPIQIATFLIPLGGSPACGCPINYSKPCVKVRVLLKWKFLEIFSEKM